RIGDTVLVQFADALPQQVHCRVDLPLLAFVDDDTKHLPNILDGRNMLPAIAKHVYGPHQAPRLQFANAGADVRAGDAQHGRDLFSSKRFCGNVQERMYLSDGAIDTPACSHLAPVKDKLFFRCIQLRHGLISLISVMTEDTEMYARCQVAFLIRLVPENLPSQGMICGMVCRNRNTLAPISLMVWFAGFPIGPTTLTASTPTEVSLAALAKLTSLLLKARSEYTAFQDSRLM